MSRISSTLGLIALACGATVAQAGTGLGLDSGVGLLSFDDVRLSNGKFNGNVLVGGDATITGLSINGRGGNSLLVGGDLAFAGGSIGGGNLAVGGGLNALYGLQPENGNTFTVWGSISVPDWSKVYITPGSGSFAPGFDFGAEQSRLTALSTQLGKQPASGAAQLQSSTLHFDATGQSLAVFDIDAADASKNMKIDGLANDASVIINVHGSAVDFGNHGYDNFGSGQVLFNFADAKSITFNGGVSASFLAPQAAVTASNGTIYGQVVANSFESSHLTFNSVAFNGTLPLAAAVPEPGTGLMLLAGLGAVGLVARRRLGR